MEFSKELRDDVTGGDITVSFRLWRRPKVKAGGRYPVGPVHIEVDSVELIPFSAITAADVRRSGEPDASAVAQFGAPVRTARIGAYEVLVWNHDLLPAVTGGFARGCGPPWLEAEHIGG